MSSGARIFKTKHSGMKCAVCDNTKEIEFLELVYGGLFSRWRCKKCGTTWRLDERQPLHPMEIKSSKKARAINNPYNSFSRGINKELANKING